MEKGPRAPKVRVMARRPSRARGVVGLGIDESTYFAFRISTTAVNHRGGWIIIKWWDNIDAVRARASPFRVRRQSGARTPTPESPMQHLLPHKAYK